MKKTSPAVPSCLPKFRIHKASGRAYVELSGRRFYLGKAEDPASLQAYHAKVAEWLASGCRASVPADEITVTEVAAEFIKHADVYYRHADGTPTDQIMMVSRVLKDWESLYGPTAHPILGR